MRTPSRSRAARRVLAIAVPLAVAASGVSALPAVAVQPADGADPAGNNGTVKISMHQDDGTPLSSCTFDIEWYGFDEGADVISTVEFTTQGAGSAVAPLIAGPSEVFVGGDPASGAGTNTGFDGAATYTVTTIGEADPQSHHLKVTVHTPRSQGADTKHKVLWVEPCVEIPPPNES